MPNVFLLGFLAGALTALIGVLLGYFVIGPLLCGRKIL